jgi:hypothetical protein
MARRRTAPLILTLLITASAGASEIARAEDCLAGPNGASPPGRHWYYRIDRASHRKCWYLGDLNRRRAAAQTNTRRKVTAPPEEPEEDAAPAPAIPARAAAPEPGLRAGSPEPVPSAAIVAGPRADPAPARVAAADPVVPAPLGARPVTTERVRYEPAPPKAPEAPKPQAAAPAPAPAAASETDSALPAALFGIALLLGLVGIILVHARSRVIKIQRPAARPRRSLSEILSQAELAGRPDEHEARYPGLPHERPAHFVPRGMRATNSMRATEPRDIAAATLQPAIDPVVPEAIEPAPDVEQSLRNLLAEWERRAA